jgi:signal peptidase II
MKRLWAFLTMAAAVGIDQWLKWIVVRDLKPIDTYPVIENIFHFTYVENRGAAFGIFQGQTWLTIWFTALVLLAGIVATAAGKLDKSPYLFPFALIFGGGLGNLIDRIFRGYVVDFIHLKIINFAVFNFADICVTVGTVLFIIVLLFVDVKNRKKESAVPAEDTAEKPVGSADPVDEAEKKA